MSPLAQSDLDAPFHGEVLSELRTSKMQQMRNLKITTGIYKKRRVGRIYVTLTGLESDEHDLTFHGGIDKAIHQYCPMHYETWRTEYPESAEHFQVGAFGENIVTQNMNERNVCIGDKVKIGDDVLLEVSLPRQPCFKLNHRFFLKGFAPQTWKKSRTGWYYRVLKEGYIGEGDKVELVERKHPTWTIERVQEYLHRDKTNLEKIEELSRIEEFGDECKGAFKQRLTDLKAKVELHTNGPKQRNPEIWKEYEVVEKKLQTSRVFSLQLQNIDDEFNEIGPGAFVRLKLPNGLIRSYSIIGDDSNRFELGVALDDSSRGGSAYIHSTLSQGDKILVGKVTPGVPISGSSSNHIFIAGGIGLTAFLSHTHVYNQINFNYEFHYAVRSGTELPFPEILAKMGTKLVLYDSSKGERMDIDKIIRNRAWNSFVYVCGPQRMVDECRRTSTAYGMKSDEIHFEAFQAGISGDPYTVELNKSKRTLSVGPDESLLQVLRSAGLDVDSSCETGNCGTCKIELCSGRVDHRGSALSDEEKTKELLSCVSRGVGHIVIDF